MEVLDRAHIGGQQLVDPCLARPGREEGGNLALDDHPLLGRECESHVEARLARRHAVVEAEHSHEAAERADGAGMNPEELAVGTLERPRDDAQSTRAASPGAQHRFACARRCVALAPEHRVIRERAVEKRRLDMTAVPVVHPAQERADDADHRQVSRPDAREREPLQ